MDIRSFYKHKPATQTVPAPAHPHAHPVAAAHPVAHSLPVRPPTPHPSPATPLVAHPLGHASHLPPTAVPLVAHPAGHAPHPVHRPPLIQHRPDPPHHLHHPTHPGLISNICLSLFLGSASTLYMLGDNNMDKRIQGAIFGC